MAAYPGLQKRGGRYSIRVRVPNRLRPIVGKREITKALGTADKREALARLHPARTEVERLFRAADRRLAELRHSTSQADAPEPSQDMVVEAIKAWLGDTERQALAMPAISQERDLEDVLADLRSDYC